MDGEYRVLQGLQLTERVNTVLDVHLPWSNVGVVPPKTRGCVYLIDGWKGWDGGGGGKATALFRKRGVPGVHLERGQNRD